MSSSLSPKGGWRLVLGLFAALAFFLAPWVYSGLHKRSHNIAQLSEATRMVLAGYEVPAKAFAWYLSLESDEKVMVIESVAWTLRVPPEKIAKLLEGLVVRSRTIQPLLPPSLRATNSPKLVVFGDFLCLASWV